MKIDGLIPVTIVDPPGEASRGTVLLYHGLTASREGQGKEIDRLARGGFRVVAVDAPGHGERRWPDLEARLEGDSSRLLLGIVQEAVDEVPRVLDHLQGRSTGTLGPFAIAGISMGAYIAFAALGREKRLSAAVPILGSPDWRTVVRGEADADTRRILEQSPHLHLAGFHGKAVLALNAGRDVHVLPTPARHFVEQLRGRYPDAVERYTYVLYPESEHFMREEDWEDVLSRTVTWLQRALGQNSRKRV